MTFCTHCGAALDENARFCTSCGAPSEQPASSAAQPSIQTPAASPAPAAPATTGSKFPLGKFVLVFLGFIMLITGGVAYAAYKSPLGQAIVHMFRHEAPPPDETNVQRAGMGTPEVQGDVPAEDSGQSQSTGTSPKPDLATMKAIENSTLSPEMKKVVLGLMKGDKAAPEKLRDSSPSGLCKMDNGVIIKNYPGARSFEGHDEYMGVETSQPTSVLTPDDAATVTSWLIANNASCLGGSERRYNMYYIGTKPECSKAESVGISVAAVKEGSIIVAHCSRLEP